MMPLREVLARFLSNMESAMAMQDEKKADSWKTHDIDNLFSKTSRSVGLLFNHHVSSSSFNRKTVADLGKCQKACIDVANYCMMIYERADMLIQAKENPTTTATDIPKKAKTIK